MVLNFSLRGGAVSNLIRFYSLANRLYVCNISENQTLTTLRDTLLPKLISGEMRVKDAEQTLSEVL